MKLQDVFAYMKKVYGITPEYRWGAYPDYSILVNPESGKWIAFCMMEGVQDTISFHQESMDISCLPAREDLRSYAGFYTSFRMRGQWLGVILNQASDERVKQALDSAVKSTSPGSEKPGHTITLDAEKRKPGYTSTSIPETVSFTSRQEEETPRRILEMIRMYDYGHYTYLDRCRNFFRQGMFMKDYEDNCPYEGNVLLNQPVYHNLNIPQLRGYFTWRKDVRRGIYHRTNDAFAKMYLYEIINLIGISSREDGLEKMEQFQEEYVDKGYGGIPLDSLLRSCRKDYCIVYNLSLKGVNLAAEEEEQYIAVFQNADCEDASFLNAARHLSGALGSFEKIYQKSLQEAQFLLHRVFKDLEEKSRTETDLLMQCFGMQDERRWFPFASAVYYNRKGSENQIYKINDVHFYEYRDEVWYESSYHMAAFNRPLLHSIMHETDRQMRRYFHISRSLKPQSTPGWIDEAIAQSIQKYDQEKREASRPEIVIHADHLEQIREDALYTRDLLLTDEERQAEAEEKKQEEAQKAAVKETSSPLNAMETELLRMVLRGENTSAWLRAKHLFASTAADEINEKLYDRFNDSVLECDGSRITLIEDYRQDLTELVKEGA